jgi:enolase
MNITALRARGILDSRGNPTIEVDCTLAGGAVGRAAVPSGASTGTHEAVELRDRNPKQYHGQGVEQAILHVHQEISKAVTGVDWKDQAQLDQALIKLDGTANKSRLGANAILAVSLAFLKAQSVAANQPLYQYLHQTFAPDRPLRLPLPLINVLNGGVHARGGSDIQEIMLVPVGAKRWTDAIRMVSEIFQTLKTMLAAAGQPTTVGDEGGFAPHLTKGNSEALDWLVAAIEEAGYRPGQDTAIAIDVAASELYRSKCYHLAQDQTELTSADQVNWLEQLIKKYPIVSVEDGLAEDDVIGWQTLTKKLGAKVQLVGDDLFVTDPKRLKAGIKKGLANSVLIKPNQIGTFTEMLATVRLAQQSGYRTIMSHRSGETEDTTIAHLAVGLGMSQIKTGSVSRGERTAKYNELTRIGEQLASNPPFAGGDALKRA